MNPRVEDSLALPVVTRLLLVEDDEDDYLLTRGLLKELRGNSFELDWADNYDHALEMVADSTYDVLLLDYRLGARNGVELMRECFASGCRTPVILLTGQGDLDVDLDAMRAGAADYLVKDHIDAPMLERSIRYAMAHHRAKAQIEELNRQLEQRVRERTAALEFANRELQAFAHSVSHDLQAPLRVIGGFGAMLREDFAPTLGAEGGRYVNQIVSEAERMGVLIKALMKLSRATTSELERAPVDLSALARNIADGLCAADPGRDVEFRIEPNVSVEGDAGLLRIALDNLLGNAWKFTARGGHALIEFATITQDGQPAYLVRDNGAGFNMAYAGKLFGVFQRFHRADEFPGTGVGLSIVERIVHRHGGRIWAQSEEGKGSTFFFTLDGWT